MRPPAGVGCCPRLPPPGVAAIVLLFLLQLFCPLLLVGAEEASAYSRALAAYQDRQLDEAFLYAKEAVRQEPEHTDAHLLLGELYYLRQDLTKARECWERARKLNPFREEVKQLLVKLDKEAKVERELARSDTYPFVVRFAEGEAGTRLGDLRLLLRDAYRLVGQQMDYFPEHPITVLLYPAANFDAVKGVSHQVAGLYDGKIRLPLPKGNRPGEEIKRVLWHEYTHALVHDLSKGRCPVWLNEGIATLQEARVRPMDLRAVKRAHEQGKLLSWESLWKDGYAEGDLELHYGQAHLAAKYLVKRWGWQRMNGLLKRLGRGTPLSGALKAEYQEEPGTLEQEWRMWLRQNL